MINTKLPLYGIFVVTGIISGLFVIYKNIKKLNYLKNENYGLILYVLLGIIFGAKYFTLIANYNKYKEYTDFINIGLSSYGAVIGIIILLIIFAKQFKKNLYELMNSILPSVPLMYSLGKIGCFISGCCYGIKYNGPFNVTYNYSFSAPKGVGLFPVQLFESIIFFAIYLVIKNKKISIGKTVIICGISKFILDYFRMNHLGKVITVNQIISILFVIVGLVLLFVKEKKKKPILTK